MRQIIVGGIEMTENICKYCKYFETNESYCKKLKTTKSQKSSCDEFKKSRFAHLKVMV